MSMSVKRVTAHSTHKNGGLPPHAVPSTNDPTQSVKQLRGLGAGFTIKGKADANGIVPSFLSLEIAVGTKVTVDLHRGETALQSAKALKKQLETFTRGSMSAKITRESNGTVKFQAVRHPIPPNA